MTICLCSLPNLALHRAGVFHGACRQACPAWALTPRFQPYRAAAVETAEGLGPARARPSAVCFLLHCPWAWQIPHFLVSRETVRSVAPGRISRLPLTPSPFSIITGEQERRWGWCPDFPPQSKKRWSGHPTDLNSLAECSATLAFLGLIVNPRLKHRDRFSAAPRAWFSWRQPESSWRLCQKSA